MRSRVARLLLPALLAAATCIVPALAVADCPNGICEEESGENCFTCPQDCDQCCGNTKCEPQFDETCHNCSIDCGPCCGNKDCQAQFGETCHTCPFDCGECCGNGKCEPLYSENCQTCEDDCMECCGNGVCEPLLDGGCGVCILDCGLCPAQCGNGKLEAGEECDDGNNLPADGCSQTCKSEPIDAGSIIVTEIMKDPTSVLDKNGEWFEIFNNRPYPINMDGFFLEDLNGESHQISNGGKLIILPGQYMVFGPNANKATNGGVNVNYVFSSFNLGNGGDQVIIRHNKTILDSVEYNVVVFPDQPGHSLTLHPKALNHKDNDNGANWCPAASPMPNGDFGTPGAPNDPCQGFCGDGIIDPQYEECDNGPSNSDWNQDACRSNCKNAGCGDKVVDTGEQCDDGNLFPGDGCTPTCQFEIPDPVCGNGKVEAGEQCDDGNLFPGDGCQPDCTFTVQPAVCGNGKLEEGEGCDDGNTLSGDGCNAVCLIESGEAACGNGTVEPGEQCDDQNLNALDGCSPDCLWEPLPVCGDNFFHPAWEECDDGNTVSGDGCSETCEIEVIKPGVIIITEIMVNPVAVSDGKGEWFEVFNTSSWPIDMNGWVIEDGIAAKHTIDSPLGFWLQPGQHRVLGVNGNSNVNGGVTVDYTYGVEINFGNSSDGIVLRPAEGSLTVVDEVWYDDKTFPDEGGKTMSLDPLYYNAKSNDDGSRWCVASTNDKLLWGDYGTPGKLNPPCFGGLCGDGVLFAQEQCDKGPAGPWGCCNDVTCQWKKKCCGNAACESPENCLSCPVDCGACCSPSCIGKECGDDGCKGVCGYCPAQKPACQAGKCVEGCSPDCLEKECGDDGCGGSCGECPTDLPLCVAGLCVSECTPDCEGVECGDDGCEGSCGECANPALTCEQGKCVCKPKCEGKSCGEDGCGGSCGSCEYPLDECIDGVCVCQGSCEGMSCGDDGCGVDCGECAQGQTCVEGQCECAPYCEGKVCGDDGCGNQCGSCGDGFACLNGACVELVADEYFSDVGPIVIEGQSSPENGEGKGGGGCALASSRSGSAPWTLLFITLFLVVAAIATKTSGFRLENRRK